MTGNDKCPHCGADAVLPILYGLPAGEAMAAAERGEVLLAGCLISEGDPTSACRNCGSSWCSSEDRSSSEISRKFADYFSSWAIELPRGAEDAASRGTIYKAGWTINYLFGHDDEKYIEFYATHRMTNDRRHRIYESGRVESLEAIQEMYIYDPKISGSEQEARERYRTHNRQVARELRSLRLYPEGDINAYLRTNDVPHSGDTSKDASLPASDLLVSGLRRAYQWFKPNQLAYLSLTSKPEFVIRDQLAWRLHSNLSPDALVAREWQAKGKGAFHSDLAVLSADRREPLLLLEIKAMYTFDAVKKSREQFPLYVEADIAKSWAFASKETHIYALLLVVHPSDELPALEPIKFRAGANAAYRRHGAATLREAATTYLDQRLAKIAKIAAKGSIPAGTAFGVTVELLYWLIGPATRTSEESGLHSLTE